MFAILIFDWTKFLTSPLKRQMADAKGNALKAITHSSFRNPHHLHRHAAEQGVLLRSYLIYEFSALSVIMESESAGFH